MNKNKINKKKINKKITLLIIKIVREVKKKIKDKMLVRIRREMYQMVNGVMMMTFLKMRITLAFNLLRTNKLLKMKKQKKLTAQIKLINKNSIIIIQIIKKLNYNKGIIMKMKKKIHQQQKTNKKKVYKILKINQFYNRVNNKNRIIILNQNNHQLYNNKLIRMLMQILIIIKIMGRIKSKN